MTYDQTSQRFAKTKELQSQRTKADTRLQHICFCPNAPCPPTTPATENRYGLPKQTNID